MTQSPWMPWREVRILESTGSTNADLMALAEQGEASGLVLVAREQTAGRGRLDRTWTSPPGAGLWFSVLLRTTRPVADLGVVPLLTGLAVARGVQQATGLGGGGLGEGGLGDGGSAGPELKWPNDVMVQGRKLGGVLVQHSPTDALVIGIGINTGMTAEQRPIPAATSLLLEGVDVGRRDDAALLEAILEQLRQLLEPLGSVGQWPTGVLDGYRERCSTLGAQVVVHLPSGEELHGTAVDVDATGALIIERANDGQRVAVTSGDVVHLR